MSLESALKHIGNEYSVAMQKSTRLSFSSSHPLVIAAMPTLIEKGYVTASITPFGNIAYDITPEGYKASCLLPYTPEMLATSDEQAQALVKAIVTLEKLGFEFSPEEQAFIKLQPFEGDWGKVYAGHSYRYHAKTRLLEYMPYAFPVQNTRTYGGQYSRFIEKERRNGFTY